jgi:hypothetical protein
VLNLPICSGVCYSSPINSNVVVVAEPEEFLLRELCAVVSNNGVWYSKTMDDVGEKLYGLFGSNHGDWPHLYPL